MARLQVSAPGHDTTSPDFSAKGRSRPCSDSTAQTWGSCSAVTSRKTTFWRIVSRASDTPVSRIIRAMRAELLGREVTEVQRRPQREAVALTLADDVGVQPRAVGRGVTPRQLVRQLGRERHRLGLGHRRVRDDRGQHPVGDQRAPPLEDLGDERLAAHLLDEELHAGTDAVAALALLLEQVECGDAGRQQVLGFGERLERDGLAGRGAQPAAQHDLVAGAAVLGVQLRDDADVVEAGAGIVVRGGGEGDLELARQRLVRGVAQQGPDHLVGGGLHVQHLVGVHARQRRHRHVADRVAARLAGGQPGQRHDPQHVGDLRQRDAVELEALARGDVADPRRGVAVGDDRHGLELARVEPAQRGLDPDHVGVGGLADPVDAEVQALRPELVVGDLAVGEPADQLLEVGDLVQVAVAARRQVLGADRRRVDVGREHVRLDVGGGRRGHDGSFGWCVTQSVRSRQRRARPSPRWGSRSRSAGSAGPRRRPPRSWPANAPPPG